MIAKRCTYPCRCSSGRPQLNSATVNKKDRNQFVALALFYAALVAFLAWCHWLPFCQ